MSKEHYFVLSQDEQGDADATTRFPPSLHRVNRTPAAYFRVLTYAIGSLMILCLAAALAYRETSRSLLSVEQECSPEAVETAAPRLLDNMTFAETRAAPLTKLGYTADDAYSILEKASYEQVLTKFVHEVMPPELHERLLSGLSSFPSPLRPVPIALFQTDKEKPPAEAWKSWNSKNPNISINFFDDAGALEEVQKWFGDGEITQVYMALEPVVLKADFLRYLLLLLRGGVYSDIDTECLKTIPDWGHLDPGKAIFGNSTNNGQVANVVVGIEADVDDDGWDFMHHYWDDGLARPLQIVQWTMLSSPYHPIFLDAVRRIVETTRKIEQWRRERAHEMPYLGDSEAAKRLRDKKGWQQLHDRFDRAICDWTGPGVFTDSVMSYLGRVADTIWPDFHGTPWTGQPRLIGDVVVGPFISFRPYDEHRDLPQAKAQHFFHNSWQHGHEDDMTHWSRRKRHEIGHDADQCRLRTKRG